MARTRSSRRRRTPRRKLFGANGAVPLVVIALLLLLYAVQKCDEARTHERHRATYSDLERVITAPNVPEQRVDYEGMSLSFNPVRHIPNWVAWELTGSETEGNVPRATKFAADTRVAGSPDPANYTRSGFDRGHMAPAADMRWSPEAMEQTFFTTNICPQDHSLNSGTWKRLEEKCRVWARNDSAIIIVTGPVFRRPPLGTIGDEKVQIPAEFFKVILSPYADPPRAIGFIMPNGHVPGGMQQAAMSVDEVERITGHDFFSALPDSLEAIVEAQCNFHQWSRIR